MNRGDAAAATTRIFRGDESRPRRGAFIEAGARLRYNPANAEALANALVAHTNRGSTVLLAHKRRQPADDATLDILRRYFRVDQLAADGAISTLGLTKLDDKLADLDLEAAAASNCNPGFVRGTPARGSRAAVALPSAETATFAGKNGACLVADRRAVVGGLGAAALAPAVAAAATPALAARFASDDLAQPKIDQGRSELSGVSNLYYPSWMVGTWEVTQTLKRAEAPLGLRFIGGPRGDLSIAAKSLAEQRSRIDKPQALKLRFVKTNAGVVEDRLYNQRSRLDGFAGRSVVASVEYSETGGNNRRGNVALGGSADDPLTTVVVYYKGPAAQKVFSVARTTESSEASWRGSEATRSIFVAARVAIETGDPVGAAAASRPLSVPLGAAATMRVPLGAAATRVGSPRRLRDAISGLDKSKRRAADHDGL